MKMITIHLFPELMLCNKHTRFTVVHKVTSNTVILQAFKSLVIIAVSQTLCIQCICSSQEVMSSFCYLCIFFLCQYKVRGYPV